jgi:membrane protein
MVVAETHREWSADGAPRLGAALAYYTSLSVAPLLLIAIGIAGMVFGQKAAQGQILDQLRALIGDDGARAIQEMLAHQRPGAGVVATIVGVVTLLAGSSGVFAELQDALNTVWNVAPRPDRPWRDVIRDRFLSLTMVLGTGFLLLVSLLISAAVAGAASVLKAVSPGLEAVGHGIVSIVSFAIVTMLFALIFKFLPDARIRWRDVWVGAVATALLFVVGKFAIGFYLGHASLGSAYGAAGSFVVLLVWIYYSAQILLFGAEFTQVYARARGARLEPARGSVRIAPRRPAARPQRRGA